MHRLTVVVNIYNEAANLVSFLDSLRVQDYRHFKVLMIDDGSTDNSVSMVRNHSDGLTLDLLELEHVGLRKARAAGMARVDTELACVVDADELLHPGCLGHLVAAIDDPQVGAVGGTVVSMGDGWVVRGSRVVMEGALGAMRHADGTAEHVSGGCFVVRTAVVREMGGLVQSDVAEDADLAWRLTAAGYKVLWSQDAIVYHRDPQTLWGILRWGVKIGKLGFHTNWKHKRRLLKWHQLVKFAPLGTMVVLPLYRPLAMLGLVVSMLGFLYYVRRADYSLLDKLIGWVVFWIKSLGWDLGFVWALIQHFIRRLSSDGIHRIIGAIT